MLVCPTVFIVDDDLSMRNSLVVLLGGVGFNTLSFASAEELLELLADESAWNNESPRCLILDIRLAGLSGFGLIERLNELDEAMPVILITGYSNVSMAVKAMRAGVLDYIEKPFSKQDLLQRVSEAIDRDAEYRRQQSRRAEIISRFLTLSTREREVMDMLVAGDQTQQIAQGLRIGTKTVAKHRLRLFEKMRVDSVAALVRVAVKFSLVDSESEFDDE